MADEAPLFDQVESWLDAYRHHVMTVRSPDGMSQMPMVPQFRLDEVLDLLEKLEKQFSLAPKLRRAFEGANGIVVKQNEYIFGLSELDLERIRRLLRVNDRLGGRETKDEKQAGQ